MLTRLFQKLPFLGRLIFINVGSNLIGFFLVQALLRYAQPVENWGRLHDLEKEVNLFLLSILIPGASLFLWWVSRPVAPIFDAIKAGREVDRLGLARARRRVINMPFWVAGMNLVAWIIPAVVFPAVLRMRLDLSMAKTAVFILYNFINALMITLLAFVILEYSCRKTVIPCMFPNGRIHEQKGTIILNIRHKLMIMYLAICLLPMFQITLMTKTYSSFSGNSVDAASRLQDLGVFSLIIFGFTAIYGLWLAVLFAKNLAEPASEIMAVTEKIRNGHFDGHVKVVSNDEIGYLGDRVNEMTRGLKEREEIKEAFNLLTSPEISAEILSGRVQRGGETRVVTLLFADLRNFTTMAERLPPETTLEAINSYFAEMTEAIISNNGVVLQYVGDEIEAVFGAPQNDPDHAEHAVQAALAMRESLKRLNVTRLAGGMEPLKHGIGVHTGPALAGIVGSAYKISYAMVGDTVNIASRVQDLTKKFNTDILISAQTRELLKHPPLLSEPVKMSLKGKNSSVEVCKAL